MVSYVGPKPIPSSVAVTGGFRLPRDPKDVVRDPSLAMQTFTQEFYHHYEPEHAKYSSEVLARFHGDNCRFGPSSYEQGSMMQKSDTFRQP